MMPSVLKICSDFLKLCIVFQPLAVLLQSVSSFCQNLRYIVMMTKVFSLLSTMQHTLSELESERAFIGKYACANKEFVLVSYTSSSQRQQ